MDSSLPPRTPHSGVGIASFVLSVVVGCLIFVTFVAAGVMEASQPGGLAKHSGAAMIIGLAVIGLIILDVAALVLGITGLFQAARNRTFAILGTTFSGLVLVATALLLIVGLMA